MAQRKPVKAVSDEERVIGALRVMAREDCPKEEFDEALKTTLVAGSRILAKGLRGTFKVMANVMNNAQRARNG